MVNSILHCIPPGKVSHIHLALLPRGVLFLHKLCDMLYILLSFFFYILDCINTMSIGWWSEFPSVLLIPWPSLLYRTKNLQNLNISQAQTLSSCICTPQKSLTKVSVSVLPPNSSVKPLVYFRVFNQLSLKSSGSQVHVDPTPD